MGWEFGPDRVVGGGLESGWEGCGGSPGIFGGLHPHQYEYTRTEPEQ